MYTVRGGRKLTLGHSVATIWWLGRCLRGSPPSAEPLRGPGISLLAKFWILYAKSDLEIGYGYE